MIKKTPTVSIITPTYNRPALLFEAIQSVLSQTFGGWEMLIVEDGSDGAARSVVAGFNDPRLRYIYQAHAGRSGARNHGLAAATGIYISFLDDDDLYHPHKLANEISFLEAHPEVEIVGSGYRSLNKAGEVLKTYKPWISTPQLGQHNVLYGCPLITCSVLIKRAALDKMDHWFDPAFELGEDGDFFLRLLLSGARFSWLKEMTSDYRQIHHRPTSIVVDQHRRFRDILDKIFKTHDLPVEIRDQYPAIQRQANMRFAWRAYAYHLEKTAQRFLLLALIQEPNLADEQADAILDSLLNFAHNSNDVDDPQAYLGYVLAHLPSPLQHLAHWVTAKPQKIPEGGVIDDFGM